MHRLVLFHDHQALEPLIVVIVRLTQDDPTPKTHSHLGAWRSVKWSFIGRRLRPPARCEQQQFKGVNCTFITDE